MEVNYHMKQEVYIEVSTAPYPYGSSTNFILKLLDEDRREELNIFLDDADRKRLIKALEVN